MLIFSGQFSILNCKLKSSLTIQLMHVEFTRKTSNQSGFKEKRIMKVTRKETILRCDWTKLKLQFKKNIICLKIIEKYKFLTPYRLILCSNLQAIRSFWTIHISTHIQFFFQTEKLRRRSYSTWQNFNLDPLKQQRKNRDKTKFFRPPLSCYIICGRFLRKIGFKCSNSEQSGMGNGNCIK